MTLPLDLALVLFFIFILYRISFIGKERLLLKQSLVEEADQAKWKKYYFMLFFEIFMNVLWIVLFVWWCYWIVVRWVT